jgi:tetratricopeptide (TPR) repeat protein
MPRFLGIALLALTPAYLAGDQRLDEAVAKADAQLAKGKDAEAIKILRKAAGQAPADPEAQLALGRVLARLGQAEEARSTHEKVRRLAAGAPAAARARALAGLSAYELRSGTAAAALTAAREAVEAETGAASLAALARAQAHMGDPAARETADKAVHAATKSSMAHLALGDALLSARLFEAAAEAYRKTLELDPRSSEAGIGLALALAGLGKPAEATAAARAAGQMDPRSGEAMAALAIAALRQDPVDKQNESIAAAQQGSFLEPRSARLKVVLGRVFESRSQLDQALAAYEEAARLDASWPPPRVAALELQLRKGDVDGTLAGVRALPKELATSPEAQLLLGRILLRKEKAAAARAALEAAVQGLPGLAEAQAAYGTAAYDVGDLTVAADAYGRAVKLEPDNLAYRSNYGLFLGYDGRLDEGEKVLRELTGHPGYDDPGGFINLGWVERNFKPPKVSESVAAYERALKQDPQSGQAALGIALAYRAGHQWARAIKGYEQVSTIDRRLEKDALLGTGWCHLRAGDTYKAGFFAGLAAKAGADVKALREALSRQAKATPPPSGPVAPVARPEDELGELVDQLGSRNAGAQVRAVTALVALGRPAVPYLGSALRQRSTSIAAREAIVDGLVRLGPAAREALPHLEYLIREGPPVPDVDATREQMAAQMREAQLVSAIQAAAAKIRGK